MENNDEYDPLIHKNPGPEEKEAIEDYERKQENPVSPKQDVLIRKMLCCSKILDSEYQELKSILDKQVNSSYTASVFIDHILSLVKFRRTFGSRKHKAYKKCLWCKSREQIVRVIDIKCGRAFWCCYKCYINLDVERFFLANNYRGNDGFAKFKIIESQEHKEHFAPARKQRAEEKRQKMKQRMEEFAESMKRKPETEEASADLHRKYDYTPEQEEADDELRHEKRENSDESNPLATYEDKDEMYYDTKGKARMPPKDY